MLYAYSDARFAWSNQQTNKKSVDIICVSKARGLLVLLILIEFPRNRNELVYGRHKSCLHISDPRLYYHRYRVAPRGPFMMISVSRTVPLCKPWQRRFDQLARQPIFSIIYKAAREHHLSGTVAPPLPRVIHQICKTSTIYACISAAGVLAKSLCELNRSILTANSVPKRAQTEYRMEY